MQNIRCDDVLILHCVGMSDDVTLKAPRGHKLDDVSAQTVLQLVSKMY